MPDETGANVNYRNNVKLCDRLAAEYALGTLKGGARRRFEGWMHDDAALRRSVGEWQDRLAPMVEFAGPAMPRQQVWRTIERRLDLRRAPTLLQRWGIDALAFWRNLGIGASVAAALLVLVLGGQAFNAPAIDYVASLTDEQSKEAFLVTVDQRHQVLEIKVMAGTQVPSDKTLQLWAVPKQGAPRSLGLVASAQATRLALPGRATGEDVVLLAVSLEPKGGSPNPNGPTGPILYKGKWLRLG
jgi:anti-sigma-K factor RskA